MTKQMDELREKYKKVKKWHDDSVKGTVVIPKK